MGRRTCAFGLNSLKLAFYLLSVVGLVKCHGVSRTFFQPALLFCGLIFSSQILSFSGRGNSTPRVGVISFFCASALHVPSSALSRCPAVPVSSVRPVVHRHFPNTPPPLLRLPKLARELLTLSPLLYLPFRFLLRRKLVFSVKNFCPVASHLPNIQIGGELSKSLSPVPH